EDRVLQQRVHGGQLRGQVLVARRQDRLPQRGLRVRGNQHEASIPLHHNRFHDYPVIRPRTVGGSPTYSQVKPPNPADYFGAKKLRRPASDRRGGWPCWGESVGLAPG